MSDADNFAECSNCECDKVPIRMGISSLGDLVVCPECGATLRVEGDYVDGENWGFWLETESAPPNPDKPSTCQ